MSRTDGLWVGLKLLGAFFVVAGLAEASTGVYDLAFGGWRADPARDPDAHRALVRAGVMAGGGLWLVLTADFFAPPPGWRPRRSDEGLPPE